MSLRPAATLGAAAGPHNSEAMHVMLRRGPDNGQSLAELGLILGLIAIVVIVALALMGGQVSGVLNTVSTPV